MLNPGTDARKSPALFFMCGKGEQSGLEAVLLRLDIGYRSVLNCIQFLQASDGVGLPFDGWSLREEGARWSSTNEAVLLQTSMLD